MRFYTNNVGRDNRKENPYFKTLYAPCVIYLVGTNITVYMEVTIWNELALELSKCVVYSSCAYYVLSVQFTPDYPQQTYPWLIYA